MVTLDTVSADAITQLKVGELVVPQRPSLARCLIHCDLAQSSTNIWRGRGDWTYEAVVANACPL